MCYKIFDPHAEINAYQSRSEATFWTGVGLLVGGAVCSLSVCVYVLIGRRNDNPTVQKDAHNELQHV
jgi:hypothetical protein